VSGAAKPANTPLLAKLADFRIDFAAAAAFIGLPQPVPDFIMPADRPESPVPLAEIAHGPSAFEQFLDRNQKNLVILAILLVIAAAGIVVYRGVEQSRQHSAGADFNKAADLATLKAVIDNHPNTSAAHSAAILLAEQQWTQGQQDAAVAGLRAFIDANPDHPALATARATLGAKLMVQGKAADATTVFQQIVDDTRSRYLTPYALISLGDLAKVGGDLDKAETFYNRAKADFPDSGFASTASERIASLRATPPVEVEPPPAPPAEAAPAAPNATSPPPLVPAPSEAAPSEQTPAPAQQTAPAGEPAPATE
jgi:predicted negative regulator of RcsB-dependent stress response